MKDKEKDFEARLKKFALACIRLIHLLPKSQKNLIYSKQLIRCSSSIGANYSEAVCSLTRKDFTYGINRCLKETKESHYWLELILQTNPVFALQIQPVFKESHELLKLRGLRALGIFVRAPSERKSAEANLLRSIRGLITLGFREGGLKIFQKSAIALRKK